MAIGRVLILAGFLLACTGLLFILADRANLPIGRLPGDFLWRRGNTVVYFPIVTCILLSLFGSLVLWLLGKR